MTKHYFTGDNDIDFLSNTKSLSAQKMKNHKLIVTIEELEDLIMELQENFQRKIVDKKKKFPLKIIETEKNTWEIDK